MKPESPIIQPWKEYTGTLQNWISELIEADNALTDIEKVDANTLHQSSVTSAVLAAIEILLFQKNFSKLFELIDAAKRIGLWEVRLCESIAKALFTLGKHEDLRSQMHIWMHYAGHRPDILRIALGTFHAIKDKEGATQAKTRLIDYDLSNSQVYVVYREFLARLGVTSFLGRYLCETPPHHHRPRLLYPIGGDKTITLDSFTINVNFNFSNFLIQIANAIQFADRAGVKVIYANYYGAAEHVFHDPAPVVCKISGIVILFEQPSAESISLSGCYFFLRETFPSLLLGTSTIRQCLQSFLHATKFAEAPNIPRQGQRVLTMHIRSGDIFKHMIHPLYGQPPKSYYLKAIHHYKPCSVLLVYEDDSNPVVAALRDQLFSEKIDFEESSSSCVFDDARHLATAEALVIGAGTFAVGPLCFNKVIHTLYTFNHSHYSTHLPLPTPIKSVTHINIADFNSDYVNTIMNGNWANTPEQRELMLTYPEASLRIETFISPSCD